VRFNVKIFLALLAGMIFAAMPPLNWWLTHKVDPGLGARIADLATMFIASSAWKDLWSPDLTTAGMAAARGAALAVIYYAVGHARFAQRDL
jgi:hypothetical protein